MDWMLRLLFSGILAPLGVAALAGLFAVMLPKHLRRARDCAVSAPLNAGIVGLLTLIVVSGLSWLYGISLSLVIPLCLAPVAFAFWIGMAILVFVGWIVVADIFGRILLARFEIYAAPMINTIIGTFALTLLLVALNAVPCISGLTNIFASALVSVGVGALLLTRGGRETYPSRTVHRLETV